MKRRVYLNPKQIEFVQHEAETGVFMGGRAVGKSSVLCCKTAIRVKHMPGGHSFLSSTTYGQMLTKTLPAMIGMWKRMGLVEGLHYVVGIKPPNWYKQPFSPPRKFNNCISFWNGHVVSLISMDRPDLGRGGSYCGGDVDEAALVPREHFTRVLLPSCRGDLIELGKKKLYGQVNLYTSVPWKSTGKYILDYEKKAQEKPQLYHFTRSVSADNVHVIGQDYLDRMKRELSPIEYRMEILNEAVHEAEMRFYHAFNGDRHAYMPTYMYEEQEQGLDHVRGIKEYWPEQLLELSFDFGGWFSCMGIWQTQRVGNRNVEHMINSIGVKGEKQMVSALVARFAKEYQHHRRKVVRVWGEPRGHDRNAIDLSIYAIIEAELNRYGWQVEVAVKPVQTARHVDRHQFLNECFGESPMMTHLPLVRINQETCKDPIIALMQCEIKPDLTKNKKGERDPNALQEHQPHHTDHIDYYLYYKYSAEGIALLADSQGGSGGEFFTT